jgi:hypothetical protein
MHFAVIFLSPGGYRQVRIEERAAVAKPHRISEAGKHGRVFWCLGTEQETRKQTVPGRLPARGLRSH